MKKMPLRVYLADLVHNYLGAGSYMFPLNIGYLAAYARQELGDAIEVRLFKYPDRLLAAIADAPPDVLGLSHYTWNSALNRHCTTFCRERNPSAWIVYGGPNLTLTDEGLARFFANHTAADMHVVQQGEVPFVELLRCYQSVGGRRDCPATVPGGVIWRGPDGRAVRGPEHKPAVDLSMIPSPYLTGVLDDFFAHPLIPIIEASRGCPYRCTFCAQGLSSGHTVRFYPPERVTAEIDYIAARVRLTNLLSFADANFGLTDDYRAICAAVARTRDATGYPRKCQMNWAKNQPRLPEIARELNRDNYLIISLQSLDPEVLRRCGRENISTPVFRRIVDEINIAGGVSGTEIILGLPGETVSSHYATLRRLFDWGVSYIIGYNGLVLEGTELAERRDRGEEQLQTRWRLIDSAFGEYAGARIFDAEEGIMDNGTMTVDELLAIRPVHWLIHFLWNYRFNYLTLYFMRARGYNPLDIILSFLSTGAEAPSPLSQLLADFAADARAEWFASPQALAHAYAVEDRFAMLASGEHGKLNGKYIWRVLLEAPAACAAHLMSCAQKLEPAASPFLADLVRYESARVIDFSVDLGNIGCGVNVTMAHDIPAWVEAGCPAEYGPFIRQTVCKLVLPEERRKVLAVLMAQYRHQNRNVTLRKMSEHMHCRDLFYEPVGTDVTAALPMVD